MLKSFAALLGVLATGLFLTGTAQAAPVSFTSSAVTVSNEICVANDNGGGNNCNYGLANFWTPPATTVDETGQIFRMFNIRPTGNDQPPGPDSFSFVATFDLIVNTVTYTYSALGTVLDWGPPNANSLNTAARLTWSNVTSTAGSPLVVSFLTAGPFNPAASSLSAEVRIQAREIVNVIPLPAGILLLGTGLLGLAAFSRRRKSVAAA